MHHDRREQSTARVCVRSNVRRLRIATDWPELCVSPVSERCYPSLPVHKKFAAVFLHPTRRLKPVSTCTRSTPAAMGEARGRSVGAEKVPVLPTLASIFRLDNTASSRRPSLALAGLIMDWRGIVQDIADYVDHIRGGDKSVKARFIGSRPPVSVSPPRVPSPPPGH